MDTIKILQESRYIIAEMQMVIVEQFPFTIESLSYLVAMVYNRIG